jgi:hypothetical protein
LNVFTFAINPQQLMSLRGLWFDYTQLYWSIFQKQRATSIRTQQVSKTSVLHSMLLIRQERIIKAGLLAESDLDRDFMRISTEQALVDRYAALVSVEC